MEARKPTPPLPLHLRLEKALVWVLRTPLRITGAILVFGFVAALVEYVACAVIESSNAAHFLHTFTHSIVMGAFASFFALIVLTAVRDHRNKVRSDLRRIAELNHQVRNSLQIIVYGERSVDDGERRTAVLEGVGRIEGTLRELFPLVGERANDDRPWEAHNRTHLQNHKFLHERRRYPN